MFDFIIAKDIIIFIDTRIMVHHVILIREPHMEHAGSIVARKIK